MLGETEVGGFRLKIVPQPQGKLQFTWPPYVVVLHNFTGGQDGANPYAGLTVDAGGNLYGTTGSGGIGWGTVFKLSRRGSGWIFSQLYRFRGPEDGYGPWARVVFGPDGSLYGTTTYGGQVNCNFPWGCGTIFNLKPPTSVSPNIFGGWTKTVLHTFGNPDGTYPGGDLLFDQAGNIYGTTAEGGLNSYGTVYKLAPSDGGWTENILYSFTVGVGGNYPIEGVIFDSVGNLYGTASQGGTYAAGTVFQLTPSGSGWTENVLYSFRDGNDGGYPQAGLIFDTAGNLYGTTFMGGTGNGGTAFELTPSDNGWTYTLLYALPGLGQGGPLGPLVMDADGNLYGTSYADPDPVNGNGSVFKLTPSVGGWTYTSLHDFTGGDDGAMPYGNVILDANGNLYGTASAGGAGDPVGFGVVWEITP